MLVALLNRFAADSGHDELRTVPLLFLGASAGGSFWDHVCHASSKSHDWAGPLQLSLAGSAHRCRENSDHPSPASGGRRRSGRWHRGRREAVEARAGHSKRRGLSGIQPGQGHLAGLELATAFILSWIEGVMHHRLAGGKLREIDLANTWRADNRTSRIDRSRALTADLPHTSRLPDEKTAKLWQEVVGGKQLLLLSRRRSRTVPLIAMPWLGRPPWAVLRRSAVSDRPTSSISLKLPLRVALREHLVPACIDQLALGCTALCPSIPPYGG
jgi:hypothetical protein